MDYKLLAVNTDTPSDINGEDQIQKFAYASLSRRFNTRLRGEVGINFEHQKYDNRADETDSILAIATLIYRLNRSFELEGSIIRDTASGLLTRSGTGSVRDEEDVNYTENRFRLGIRWAPPSRASRDLIVELKSLLQ